MKSGIPESSKTAVGRELKIAGLLERGQKPGVTTVKRAQKILLRKVA